MPTTVNGVGTHYYGKQNLRTRRGVCRSCNQETVLSSYDTRLWFVVIFIPIIPLGRKRIIDSCASCQRHYVANSNQYEMSRQLSISGATEKYRNEPTPESAIELHAQMLSFHMHDEAKQFRAEAEENHASSASLFASLAEHLDHMGQSGEATRLFEKAFALRPDLPEARTGVAFRKIFEKDFDKARELLSFLEKPGAGQLYSLGPLHYLAVELQKNQRHEETLQILRHLIAESPHVAQVHDFRKMVAVSEKAVGEYQNSILPQREHSLSGLFDSKDSTYSPWQRWLVFGAIATLLVALGLFGLNEYRREHRSITIVHDSPLAVEVSIDGGPAVPAFKMKKLVLAEGGHRARFSGAISDEFDFEIHSGFFERFTHSPAWVLNPGHANAFGFQTLHYSLNPKPTQFTIHAGENYLYFPHVDYLFEEPPREMKIEGKSGEVTKTQLKILIEPPSAIFSHLLNSSDLTSALNYAEGQLRIYREDAGLMNEYLFAISLGGQRDRAITFLKSGLENQPISVAWHRCYQDEYNTVEGYARLAAEYDQRLLENPNNAALLYLRGRICPDRKTSDTYFERAKEADETLAWPYFSLSVAAASDANWQEARRLLDQARDRKLPLSFLDRLDREVRFATEDLAALEVKLRSFVENTPAMNSMKEIAELCDLLVVQGKSNEIAGCVQSWNSKLPQGQPRAPEIVGFANALLRRADDFDEATINQLPQDSRLSPILRVYTRVTRGDPVAAAADPDLPKLLNEPYHAYTLGLALSLSFSLKGATDDADKWREVAADSMSKADKDNVLGAKLLRATTAPTDEQLHEVVMLPDRKMLLLAVLAQRFPERQRELLDFARRLNMGRSLTYHLVKKATEVE